MMVPCCLSQEEKSESAKDECKTSEVVGGASGWAANCPQDACEAYMMLDPENVVCPTMPPVPSQSNIQVSSFESHGRLRAESLSRSNSMSELVHRPQLRAE